MKDKEQMTVLEYLQLLEKTAKLYRSHAISSIARNKHMNRLDGICGLTQNEIDAVLVDFINYCGMCSGGDYGLKASDLGPEVPIVPVVQCPSHAAQQQIDLENLPIYELIEDDECDVTKLFGSLLAAREVADEESIIGFLTDSVTNDMFKVTIQFIGNQGDQA